MTDDATHRAEVEAWRQGRYAALRRDLGWLTLAGLGWLKPGINCIGSDADADVTLPSGPPQAGDDHAERRRNRGGWRIHARRRSRQRTAHDE